MRHRVSALAALLCLSAGLNVALARRSYEQRAYIKELKAAARPLVNQTVPPIEGFDAEGRPTRVDFDGDLPTLLYFFAPGCGYCETNVPSASRLFERIGAKCRVVGVSLESNGLGAFLATTGLSLPVVTDVPPERLMPYRVTMTPQTLLVGRGGVVMENWAGAYTGETHDEIARYFSVDFPRAPE